MDIESSFTVPLDRQSTWRVLLDIPRIAPCMPGAHLTGSDDATKSYNGEVQVRLGPVVLSFAGKARIIELIEADHKARVTAEGRDKKGRGGATAEVVFTLAEVTANETLVNIHTTLNLSGSIAQYGRGSGMINDLANHLVGQFAENLRCEVAGSETGAAAPMPISEAAEEKAPLRAASIAPISGFSLGIMLFWKQFKRLVGIK